MNSKVDERGVERCTRIVMTAISNVPNDPSKGYYNAEAICNTPITVRISDRIKGCPRCDKEPPVGNVHPRTTNSAAISLSAKELEECGVSGTAQPGIKIPIKKIKPQTMEVNVGKTKKDIIEFSIPVAVLEDATDIPRVFIQIAITAMDNLSVSNYGESRRLDKIRQQLEKLLEA